MPATTRASRVLGVAATAAALAAAGSGLGARRARAEDLEKIGKKLGGYETEVRTLSSGIRRPGELEVGPGHGRDLPTRRTIDAEVNFGVKNYEDAAIVLYDVVEKYPNHPVYDEALYYLSESLFMKGDYLASRTYFAKLVSELGTRSRYYQQSLERLIEITLKTGDSENVDKWLAALEAVPQAERRSSVPYVRGKYEFYSGKFDEAIGHFGQVVPKARYYFQARYFIGAAFVAKKDLAKAVVEYQKLVRIPPKNRDDRRVVELAYIALGRIHYERNQPSKAIDRYLQVDRHSDMFSETMYEVAWVYVRNKQFEKALRALELLALTDPLSTRLPAVKILEGNLRIRKAQRLGEANLKQASDAEYQRATFTFQNLRTIFELPRQQLDAVIAEHREPRDYLAQVTGRHAETFDIKGTIPEVAAAWLREEPEVKRIIGVETDLGQIEGDIDVANKTIYRLEQALVTPTRVNIFPALAEKKIRAIEIQDDVFAMRIQLADELRGLLGSGAGGEVERLQAERQGISAQLAALPDAKASESEKISRARARATEIDKSAAEAATLIGHVEAQLVAMEKFLKDAGGKEIKSVKDLAELKAEIQKNRADVEDMKKELGNIRADVLLAQDRAGVGDDNAVRRKELRVQLRASLDAEHNAMQAAAAQLNGSQRARAQQIDALSRHALGITARLDQAVAKIDGIADEALTEVRAVLADEKAKLAAYTGEYSNYDQESHGLGGEVLGMAFVVVAKKLYEVLMRSDVGVVDVAWSIKEGADGTLRRLTLDQARETRTLDTEFGDVIQEIRQKREEEEQRQQQKATGQGAAGGEGAKGGQP